MGTGYYCRGAGEPIHSFGGFMEHCQKVKNKLKISHLEEKASIFKKKKYLASGD